MRRNHSGAMKPLSWILRCQRKFADALLAVVNDYLDQYIDGPARSAKIDIAATAPALLDVTAAYPVIRAEFDKVFAQRDRLPCYHELDPHVSRISRGDDPVKNWRVYLLNAMGEIPAAARRDCPDTLAVLSKVPEVYQAFFSILDPGKAVPAHRGPFRGYLRYHLGLRVPRERPPVFRIIDHFYTWQEGKDLLFDDCADHEVLNESTEPRGILIVDVLRPLPPTPARFNRWFVRWVVRTLYGRRLIKNLR